MTPEKLVVLLVSIALTGAFILAALFDVSSVLREILNELRRINSTDSQDFRVSSTQRGSLK